MACPNHGMPLGVDAVDQLEGPIVDGEEVEQAVGRRRVLLAAINFNINIINVVVVAVVVVVVVVNCIDR